MLKQQTLEPNTHVYSLVQIALLSLCAKFSTSDNSIKVWVALRLKICIIGALATDKCWTQLDCFTVFFILLPLGLLLLFILYVL